MNVQAYARNTAVSSDGVVKITDFDTLISTSDIISVHVSLNEQTKQLINKAVLAKMKNSALFINTARGGIVNQTDLIEALQNGELSGACLDVYESEPLPLTVSCAIWVT